MSEISIIIPLSALPKGMPLDTTSFVQTVQDTVNAREEAQQWKQRYNELIKTWNTAGTNLELILDELSDYDKVRALREMVATLKGARMLEVE